MKTLARLVLAAAFALAASNAPAELILYKGTGRATYIGNGQSLRVNYRAHVVVDHSSNRVATILFANLFNTRVYLVGIEDDLNRSTVNGANGKTYTALTESIDDDSDDVELVIAQGADTSLPLSSSVTVQFPKKLTSALQTLVKSGPDKHLVSANLTASFDKNGTQTSNNTGETFDQAVGRLIAQLQNQGYVPAATLPGQSSAVGHFSVMTMTYTPPSSLQGLLEDPAAGSDE